MRVLLVATALIVLAVPAILPAAADSAATAPEVERYSTSATDIGSLLKDPAARAISKANSWSRWQPVLCTYCWANRLWAPPRGRPADRYSVTSVTT
jgi:hypothetical protein